jgi:hypothetical protein
MLLEIVFTDLPVDRDVVEDALDEHFGADGEVTGAGTGVGSGRSHLDLEVLDQVGQHAAVERAQGVLIALGVESYAEIYVRD